MTEPKPIRILYMEDNPGLARLLQGRLERAGYVVDLASDGSEGLAMYDARSYDVVAVDQAMPVHKGLEVIRLLASRGPLPPTIMVTGHGNEQIAVEAMKLGASDYIVKDAEGGYLELLPAVIERVLRQQRLAEKKQRAEEALRQAYDELEIRVRERTAELSEANERLKREIAERMRAEEELRQYRDHLEELVDERTAELAAAVAEAKRLNQQLEREIAERVQAEKALALAHDQALETSRLKSQLLANVGHDLRSPLGSILGYTEMLQAGVYGPLSDQQYEATKKIVAGTEQLLGFINNLLGQAQIEAGKVVLSIRPFAPVELLEAIRTTTSMVAQAKGLELISNVAPSMPSTLSGDPYWLRQILSNLVSNAIKFTEQGTVQVHIYRADENYWAMQVSDTGCGIPAEAQSYIFDAFRQVDGTITRKQHSGSGLGLSIIKQLTTLMGGQITLTSEVGQGSTFTVLLPLELTGEETA